MEAMIRKLQKIYRRAKEEMSKWDGLQNEILSQFSHASSIIDRLEVLGDIKNYGVLQKVPGIKDALLGQQMVSVETILLSMREKLKEFESIAKSIEKIERDANQLIKSGPFQSANQMQLHVGILPSLQFCLDGLKSLCEMYRSEFAVKSAIISQFNWERSSSEIADLRRLLIDQPNISKDKIQLILDVIFAEEIS